MGGNLAHRAVIDKGRRPGHVGKAVPTPSATLAPYPSPEARDQELRDLAEGAGGTVVEYGRSVEGRPLLAARLAATAAPPANGQPPRVLVTGNIHGPEFISSRVVLGTLARVSVFPPLRRLRERADLWLIPCLNPDGYARTFAAGGRGSLALLRGNARGVDLNRNFPLPDGQVRRRWPGAGSTTPGHATYVGTHPLSEPESGALARLIAEQKFHAGCNGHSFMGKTIPARTVNRASFATYRTLCRAFAQAQPLHHYGRLASRWFDTFTGELEDFQHHTHRMWASCVETFPIARSFAQHLWAPSLFWRFNPHDPEPWVDNDVAGIAAFLYAALDQERPDSDSISSGS